MMLLIDLTFFFVAAIGGASAAWLAMWLRGLPRAKAAPAEEAQFARETLARLQELTRRVAAEVDQHSECVAQINAQLASTQDNDEASVLAAVAQLIEANRRMQRLLDSAEERMKTQARQIESQAVEARTDALTQVANRRALDDELRRCAADFECRGTLTTLMLVDVDHFKKFNDTHGHQAGDDVLRTVARVLRQTVGELGLVSRYGGEEFAVVLPGLPPSAALPLCERARQAVAAATVKVGPRELRVTASAGVSAILAGDRDKDILGRADEALYASKNAGRNCGHYNDGHSNHLIRAGELSAGTILADAAWTGEKVGDEWLLDGEAATELLFREPIPHVSSRPEFFDDLIRRLAQWRRSGTPLTLLLIQIDSFSRIVSEHGPAASEVVLRVAAQLVNAVRRDLDGVTRLGEDTFALLLPGAVLGDGVAIAERLRQAVEKCRLPRKAGAKWFTISVGVVEATAGDDLRLILQRARGALHAAVNQGRNCVVARDGCASARYEQPAGVW